MKRLVSRRPFARRHLGRLPLVLVAALTVAGIAAGVGAATAVRATATSPHNDSPPAVSGTAQEGQTLSATTGTWSGDGTISYAFQWQRCNSSGAGCGDLSSATSQSYVVAHDDVGSTLRVVVTATNSSGSGTAASAPTSVVAPAGTKPAPSAQPTPQGTARVGEKLTISPGTWSGTQPITFSYQWQRCTSGGSCANIAGATNSSYTAATGDIGFALRAIVTGKNDVGSTSVSSNLTAPVVAAVGAPANSVKPSVAGSTSVGSTLTGSVGTWSGAQPISFRLAWERCDGAGNNCKTIVGATASTYKLAMADVGSTIRLFVTATNAGGSVSLTTGPTARVTTLPTGAVQLPDEKISIPVSSVSLPDRLVISSVRYTPNPVRSHGAFQARYRITDSNGYLVRGALVYALGVPYSWVRSGAEATSGTDGYAYLNITPSSKLPLTRGNGLIVFVRVRKPGGSLLAGVSTRRLTQVRVGAQ
jgi:hypothetical protein